MSLSRVIAVALILAVTTFAAVFAIEKASDAQQTECPAGTELAADGVSCLSPAVNDNVTTTVSCTTGVLSEDGKTCLVPRLDAPQPAPADAGPAAPVPAFTG